MVQINREPTGRIFVSSEPANYCNNKLGFIEIHINKLERLRRMHGLYADVKKQCQPVAVDSDLKLRYFIENKHIKLRWPGGVVSCRKPNYYHISTVFAAASDSFAANWSLLCSTS